MSSEWASKERELVKKTNKDPAGEVSAFQEFGIALVTELMQGTGLQSEPVTERIGYQILESGLSPEEAWGDFLQNIISAAKSTSSDSIHERLVGLVFALANHRENQTAADPIDATKTAEIASLSRT